MSAEGAEPGDEQAVRTACHRVLWDMRPIDADESRALMPELEGHVRALSPRVAALVPDLERHDWRGMHGGALLALRHADEVLDPRAPSMDRQARMHDLAVAARALCGVLILIGQRDREHADPSVAEDVGDPADPAGWLVADVGP